MNFIKETILTLSLKDKEEFVQFLIRKQVRQGRKDVLVFNSLYNEYTRGVQNDILKGHQNYHAVRKRLTKELINFLILKKSTNDRDGVEGKFLMIKYFIDLGRYSVAWELIEKEESKSSNKSSDVQLKLQQLKLEVMPYYASENFNDVKHKISFLQKAQIRKLQFQLSFIQIQNELKEKMTLGEVDFESNLIDKIFNQYSSIDNDTLEPEVYLRIIEIIRGEYLVQRKFKSFAVIAQKYYNKLMDQFSAEDISPSLLAQLEYIMAHAYFRVRNFEKSNKHIEVLNNVINLDATLKVKYITRYLSIKSAIDVFEGKLNEAIESHQAYIDTAGARLTLKEELNLSLNLVAYYCVAKDYRKANKVLLHINKSDSFYQRHMGREWLIRKDLIRTLIQVELNNEEIAISILDSIKKKHSDMFKTEQYAMVLFYVNTLLTFLKNPYQTSMEEITAMEDQTNFKKDKLFDDPKLLSFYVWLKSKITNKDLYELLREEYRLLG